MRLQFIMFTDRCTGLWPNCYHFHMRPLRIWDYICCPQRLLLRPIIRLVLVPASRATANAVFPLLDFLRLPPHCCVMLGWCLPVPHKRWILGLRAGDQAWT
jgi:hypothetical protein